MAKFFAELKRRHMYRVAAVYAVVAWLLLQIVNNVAPGLNLPNGAVTLVIVLLAVGFPVALVFAWIHELWAPSSGDSAAAQANRVWEYSDRLLDVHLPQSIGIRNLWPPEFAPLRRTERFKAYMRQGRAC